MSDNDRGRPSKFTDDRKKRILEAAESGANKEGCARAGGVSYSTLRNWLRKGEEEEEGEFFEFYQDFAQARARAEEQLLEDVQDRKPEWLLERSYGYWKKQEIEHSGDNLELNIVLNDEEEDDDE